MKQSLNYRLKIKFVRILITWKRLKRKMRKIIKDKDTLKNTLLMEDSGIASLCQPHYFVHIGLMLWDTYRETNLTSFNIRRIIKLLLYNWRLVIALYTRMLHAWPAMQVNIYGHNICLLFVFIIFIYLFIIQSLQREIDLNIVGDIKPKARNIFIISF